MKKVSKSCGLIETNAISREQILNIFANTHRSNTVKYYLNEVGLTLENCDLNQLYDMFLASDFFIRSEDKTKLVAVYVTRNPEEIDSKVEKFNSLLSYLKQLNINHCLVLYVNENTLPKDLDLIYLWSKCRDYSKPLFKKIDYMSQNNIWADILLLSGQNKN